MSEKNNIKIETGDHQLKNTQPREGDFEVLKLKHAKASEAAKALDEAFNNSKTNPSRIRVEADPVTNSLLVRANALDMLTVRRLIEGSIDVTNPKSIIKIWRIGPLKHAKANDVSSTIKALYKEHLNNTLSPLQRGAMRNAYFGWGGTNLNTNANDNPRSLDLTVTADEQTNTLIIGCDETIYQEIKKLIDDLDRAGQERNKRMDSLLLDPIAYAGFASR